MGLKEHISDISTDPYYDSILERVSKLFLNLVGSEPEEKQYNELISDGLERMQSNIPPGFKDYSDKKKRGQSDREALGDFLIWKQILAYAEAGKHHIILVTEDRKPDWWQVEAGKTIGPRIELRKEFFRDAGHLFHMYNLESFLEHASDVSKIKLNETSKEEIKQYEVRTSEGVDNLELTEFLVNRRKIVDEKLREFIKKFKDINVSESKKSNDEDGLLDNFSPGLSRKDINLLLKELEHKIIAHSWDRAMLYARFSELRKKSHSSSFSEGEYKEFFDVTEKLESYDIKIKKLEDERDQLTSIIDNINGRLSGVNHG
jgi:hypothetical protein